MKKKLLKVILLLIIVLFLLKEFMIDVMYEIHLFLNNYLRYAYKDNKKSKTGYWSNEQRKTHITSKQLKQNLLNYYKSKNVKKVLDLGCGNGEYVKFLKSNGINAVGVDNCGVCKGVEKWDLTKSYNNPSDYVQTFEVGEHIPKQYESMFIQNICRNAKKGIIMSWAVPGQGGDGHINEKSRKDVIYLIEKCGFKLNKDATYNMRRNMGISLRFLYFRRNLLVFDKII
jgi:hypothetical protein